MKRGGKSKKQKAQNEYISGRAFILSLYLAACVININSTKWVVIKLSRVVNNPQRSHWNIKADQLLCTSTDMQPNVYFKFVHYTEPPSQYHFSTQKRSQTHTLLFFDWLSSLKYYYLIQCGKNRKWTKCAFLRPGKKNTWQENKEVNTYYKNAYMHTHTRHCLKLTSGNSFPSIMQTNIFIALFGEWHDLWGKLPISSISVAVYQGTVKGLTARHRTRKHHS